MSLLGCAHLGRAEKKDLFKRIALALATDGRFVLGDLIVPENEADAIIDPEPGYDAPDSVADQLEWLRACGLHARLRWRRADLAVLVAEPPTSNRL